MRWFNGFVVLVLVSGCASYDPILSDPLDSSQRLSKLPHSGFPFDRVSGAYDGVPEAVRLTSPVSLPNQMSQRLRSGRGVTWGAAKHGPVRDVGLDRLMVETLTSSTPAYSRSLDCSVPPLSDDSWVYP